MTRVRRLLVVAGFLGMAAIISSSSSEGQSGKKGPVTTPQLTPAKEVSLQAEPTDSRFSMPGVLTYQPLKGDHYFALQVQPKLEPAANRPRDILVMMATTATQGGAGWIASHQIAEAVIEDVAREHDRVS